MNDFEKSQERIRRSKTYSPLEAAFTREEAKAVKASRQDLTTDLSSEIRFGLAPPVKLKVRVVLANGKVITKPMTKTERRALRKELGLKLSETV